MFLDEPGRRFERRTIEWCYRLLGAALVYSVASDISNDVWRLHRGELYPYRHLFPAIPIYPPSVLVVEWAVLAVAGVALIVGARRKIAVYCACAGLVASLSQRYANNRFLLLVILALFALRPPDPRARDFDAIDFPNLELVRYQLLIVYVFSAINKLRLGFASGDSLANLAWMLDGLPARPLLPKPIIDVLLTGTIGRVASVSTLAIELALPPLLMTAPRIGLALVLLLHVTFALLIPGVWGFTLSMTAMALLFLDRGVRRTA